ncbi:conjugal transfer protein TrbD [Campylobacter coli]|uniref:conjugal transfer protein TrbD n=1 Tax=Campylobacter coli TaxID=195 RepID=UPI0012F70488|nr:conjugal transfer protein TrbD [Campylobacter coli]EDP5699468.1 conjugal transfer protein TrbD [Campylobacter jejuni]HEO8738615.1 conjugal transfer protein TrbD [Campylobacter jejuni]
MEELHRVDIYSALNKPNLMLGADRELIMMTGLISASLIFTGATIVTTIVGVVLFFFCSLLLRLMAKSDPLMRQIFIRQNKYKKFYYPQSTPFSKD